MTTKQLSTPLNVAQLQATETDSGWKISGYATVFDNPNYYGFAIKKGAYSKLIESGVQPKMFFNHESWTVPIGKWTELREDDIGLWVEGEITKGVSQASDVYHAVKAGTVDGLSVSIGWRGADEVENSDGLTEIHNLISLSEISVVTNPADGKARINQCLSADEVDDRIERIESIRDFESFLRETAQLSKRQSGWLLAKAKAVIASDSQRDADLKAQDELAATFERLMNALDSVNSEKV